MLPLALLHAAQAKPMLVELKNGETFNGHLAGCDNFMNLTLKEDGEQFWKLPQCYIRGNNIKYIRVAENVRLVKAESRNEYSSTQVTSGSPRP
ncbi:BZ3500_MvSof-1268-A1-R1_Chr1-3g02049 [Microbotryum saponariae]|uniref:LSM complex subunit LSM4 n=1 Tax=Microbotryum saponariae TaxID=289078 RepID=A0A2X0KQT8_9BASI|nr:BZ3500_MvSof-1268-A1-R1_Chr1-3g02049 [Microbotryum saponariae]SCZ95257.1 BZ3501_MvSof-1269-A2-R1_Chr1-3g01651 [Microbotryum saponariae]